MFCMCHIVPPSALKRFADDPELSAELRQSCQDTLRVDHEFRLLRDQAHRLSQVASLMPAMAVAKTAPAGPPTVSVFDCNHSQTLPGTQVPNASGSSDATVKNVFDETTKVAQFYKAAFNRNSVDDANMALLSSIHYGSNYNNAFWNGSQMTYGDGDGKLFVDFSKGNDVIGHELTHGVTQHTLRLNYAGDAGGLNESISDCFGSMFRQWQAGQTADKADWLIGSDIMGPTAKSRGFTCLRDMADPAAAHCLAAQPTNYSQVTPGMDPHESSGPPNLAFCTACKAAGGNSWNGVGKVWYYVLTHAGSHPNMRMKDFANRTRTAASQVAPGNKALHDAIDQGWKHVGL